MIVVIGLGALVVWLGLAWVESYGDRMSDLIDTDPAQASVRLVRDLRAVAVATALSMLALAVFLASYGVRSLRTGSMPPPGSWIIEGQRIRTGADAISNAKLLLFSSAVICILGIVAAMLLWRLPGELLTGT